VKQIKQILEAAQANPLLTALVLITLIIVIGTLWYIRPKPTDEMGGELPSKPTDWTVVLSVLLALVIGWCANTAYTSQDSADVQLVSDCTDVSTLYEVTDEGTRPRYYCGYGEGENTYGCSEFK
jgi:hypothetical protein